MSFGYSNFAFYFALFSPISSLATTLHSGDLIFLKPDGQKIAHVGIIFEEKNEAGISRWIVYESVNLTARKTPLPDVLRRVNFEMDCWEFRHFKKLGWLNWKRKNKLRSFLEFKIQQLDEPITGEKLVAEAFWHVFGDKIPFSYHPPRDQSNINEQNEQTLDPLDIYLGDQMESSPVDDEDGNTMKDFTANMVSVLPLFFAILREFF